MQDIMQDWLTCGMTDRDVLGDVIQERDVGQDFVEGRNNYVWLYLLAKKLKPRFIVETGTRFGYSLAAFVKGAGWNGREFTIRSFDNESDGFECLSTCLRYVRHKLRVKDIIVYRDNTTDLGSLALDGKADLGFVDANHTEAGSFHECGLVWAALKRGGTMLVDDILNSDVRHGTDRWLKESGATASFLPTLRGLYVIEKA